MTAAALTTSYASDDRATSSFSRVITIPSKLPVDVVR
ncbi:unnamed protein product [Schistosoma curassoni]|uniref:Uncharacterized protein n=1 Tax=Schistosoma curassoni TaxID=6186 RepID=A0A183KFK3_9TREM|nr:unnamed protein product [Schistosoma curassoni]